MKCRNCEEEISCVGARRWYHEGSPGYYGCNDHRIGYLKKRKLKQLVGLYAEPHREEDIVDKILMKYGRRR